MKKRLACPLVLLALLLVLLTPASANSAPTRLGGTGGSALTVDEGCPVTVTAEQLTFDVSGAGDSNGLTAQVEAVYQMENPTENPLSVQMSFYLKSTGDIWTLWWMWTVPCPPSLPTARVSPSPSKR